MPIISSYSQKKKIKYFIDTIPKSAKVLEVGSGSGWVGAYMKKNGWENYVGLDILAPADVVGDICLWNEIGLQAESFDYIIAFEVVEHVDCFKACYELLKPNGKMLITTPMPHADWILKILEALGLNQKRTSPHSNLLYLKKEKTFDKKQVKSILSLSQWAIFEK